MGSMIALASADDRFYYRFTVSGDVHVAIRAHFDRWANSIDFVFTPPKTRRAYNKLRARLDAAIAANQYNSGGGMELRL